MRLLRLIRNWYERMVTLRDRGEYARDTHLQQIVEERITAANARQIGGNSQSALQIWRETLTQNANDRIVLRAGLSYLLDQQAFDEAEQLMQEGCRRWPSDPFFLEGTARVAERRGSHEDAAARYAILRSRFPNCRQGFVGGAKALVKLGKLDEADVVFGHVATIDNEFAWYHARLATQRKDWAAALQRWQRLYHSGHRKAPLGLAACYREMGRLDEAECLILSVMKNPKAESLAGRVELARVAEARNDWPDAARRWHEVRVGAPKTLDAYRCGAAALRKCGQETEAQELLLEARQKFPKQMAAQHRTFPELTCELVNWRSRRPDICDPTAPADPA
jgi:predicted Zn-dependent protease